MSLIPDVSASPNAGPRAIVAEKVIEYLAHKHYYTTKADKNVSIPDFQERIPPEIALEL